MNTQNKDFFISNRSSADFNPAEAALSEERKERARHDQLIINQLDELKKRIVKTEKDFEHTIDLLGDHRKFLEGEFGLVYDRLGALEKNKPIKKPKKLIPVGYITPQVFAKRYKFISSATLRDKVNANKGFFDGFIAKPTSHLFFDPVRFCAFMETGRCTSTSINNRYKSLKNDVPALKALVDKAKMRRLQ